jgi:spermidine synthase
MVAPLRKTQASISPEHRGHKTFVDPLFPALFALFFFSGFAGLIYESIWSHYLKLFLGHAAYAQTMVLVIYMGGMALGSWLASVSMHRIKNLLLGYSIVEIVIGLTALIFHPVFIHYLSFSYDTLFPAFHSSLIVSVYKWLTAPLLILPQTILLGATFPLMTSGFIRLKKDAFGHSISVLYFVNSLGGAIGVLAGGFFLIEKFAFPGTVQCAGIIDIAVGVTVFFLCTLKRDGWMVNHKTLNAQPGEPVSRPLDSTAWTVLALAGFTAASSFIYEVGWTRMLSLVLGSSTHSFELMLSAFIVGLAIGGYLIRNRLDAMKSPMIGLAKIQVAMGACAIATLVFYSKLFYLMKFFITSLTRTDAGYIMFHVYSHLICLVLMLPATILAGMTLPIITWFLYKRSGDESTIGKVYAFNTIGSIIGVLIAVHVLMPLVGLKFLLIIGSSVDMLIGLYLLWRFKEHGTSRIALALAIISFAAVVFPSVFVRLDPGLLSSGVYRTGKTDFQFRTMYYRDGKTSSVSLVESGGAYMLKNNGKTDASVGIDSTKASVDDLTQILLAAYPLAYSRTCRTVGVIGLGSGMTASVLLESDSVKAMDVVEIEPCIVEAAKLMGPKVQKVFIDKRSSIHVDDAKTFFSSHRKKYDIIISEPSNPWVSGVSSLYSVEFFSLIAKHLTADGMLVQWFHLYEMSPDLIASIIMSMNKNFLDFKAFISGTDIIILASQSPIPAIPNAYVLKNSGIAYLLQPFCIEHDYDFQCNYIGGKKSLYYLAEIFDVPLNSDYNPILDLRAVKARILSSDAEAYSSMRRFIIPVRKILENDTATGIHDVLGRKIPIDNPNNPNAVSINADYEAWQAWYYISTMGTPREAFVDSTVSRVAAITVANLRMASRDNSASIRQLWPKYVIDLLKMTMPYLPKDKMMDIWGYIDLTGKNVVVKQKSADLLTVLKKITLGDFEAACPLSHKLLESGRYNDDEFNRMLSAAFLLSSIKLNKPEGVADLWKKIGAMKYDFNLLMLYDYAIHMK